jgi:hypothetical protein
VGRVAEIRVLFPGRSRERIMVLVLGNFPRTSG